jgi:3-dehydroquinate synthetase/shikimate kinase
VDVVLVGLPGSGKSAVGRRLAFTHKAEFVDLDEVIEQRAGTAIPDIFDAEGEAGFRTREREAVAGLGPADRSAAVVRVVATGGGAVLDPRNRWLLYRRRLPIWLDARPEVLAQRLRRSPTVRPLVAGRDPIGAMRKLAGQREPFYAAAEQVNSVAQLPSVLDEVDRLIEGAPRREGTPLLRSESRLGRLSLGESIAVPALADELERLETRRAIVVTEPGAWSAVGADLAKGLAARGFGLEIVDLPQGEPAKRMAVIEKAASTLATLRVTRDEPLVAVGGGALGDAAGFLAAVWLRGVPVVHLPTSLVAQIDSSIGGKTAIDLPEGKNLIGAFHQPAAVITDVALLRSLPPRHMRAALGEAVKMAALGDERLMELLETDGDTIASGDSTAFESGAIAELVERCAWTKVQVVLADEREKASAGDGRIRLNLGHTVGHGLEAALGYAGILHGEAVAYGLRAASRIGAAVGVTPPEQAARIEGLLSKLDLGSAPPPASLEAVLEAIEADKKHGAAGLRWVLPKAAGVEVRADVPEALVREVVEGVLAGTAAEATVG